MPATTPVPAKPDAKGVATAKKVEEAKKEEVKQPLAEIEEVDKTS